MCDPCSSDTIAGIKNLTLSTERLCLTVPGVPHKAAEAIGHNYRGVPY